MLLHRRLFKGFRKPLMEVDKTLLSQGFERSGDIQQEYQLIISDPVTRSSYYLRIPCKLSKEGKQEHIYLGVPYLKRRYSYHPLDSRNGIPRSIQKAAEEKVAEVYTYLNNL